MSRKNRLVEKMQSFVKKETDHKIWRKDLVHYTEMLDFKMKDIGMALNKMISHLPDTLGMRIYFDAGDKGKARSQVWQETGCLELVGHSGLVRLIFFPTTIIADHVDTASAELHIAFDEKNEQGDWVALPDQNWLIKLQLGSRWVHEIDGELIKVKSEHVMESLNYLIKDEAFYELLIELLNWEEKKLDSFDNGEYHTVASA